MSWAATPADDDPFKDPSVSTAKASGGVDGTGYDQSAPTWLSAGQGGAQPPPPPPPGRSSTSAPRQAAAAPTAAELERQAKVPEVIVFTRAVNMCLCVFLAVAAVFELLVVQLNFATGVLACYLFAFSCILCCFETHLKVVAKTVAANFGFLYNAKGRALFLLLMALVCFSLQLLLTYIAGALMLANAIFNFYVICRYPEFQRDLQRKQLESEGRDYLRANRATIAQDGGEFARNNPDLAANGTGAAARSTYQV